LKMSLEDESAAFEPDNASSTEAAPEQDISELPVAGSEEAKPTARRGTEVPGIAGVAEQEPELDEVPPASADHQSELAESAASEVAESTLPQKPESFFRERPPQLIEVAPQVLRHWTRRDVLLFGAGAIATLAAGVSLVPQTTLERLGIVQRNKNWPKKEWLLNRALRLDDDVAEALYSRSRLVPTYTKSQITPLKNNYNGATPTPAIFQNGI
jgi:hypothetical protein